MLNCQRFLCPLVWRRASKLLASHILDGRRLARLINHARNYRNFAGFQVAELYILTSEELEQKFCDDIKF
jgi:hypothetical protein